MFQENLELIRKKHPELHQQLIQVSPDGKYQTIPTPSGHSTLLCLLPNQQPTYLHSPEDPVVEAEQLVAGLECRGEDFTVIMGFGLGYLPLAMLPSIHQEHRLFIIESELEIIYNACRHTDLSDLLSNERVHLFLTDHIQQILDALEKEQFRVLSGEVKKLIYPPAYDIDPEAYQRVEKKIEEWVAMIRNNYSGLNNHSELTVQNILNNISELPNSAPINPLVGVAKDIPALVIAAGPSLDQHMDRIRTSQAQFLIIAVDTTIKPLLSKGIKPDIVISVDPIRINLKKFKNLPSDMLDTTPLVYSPYVFPDIPRRFNGPKFIYNEHNLLSRWALGIWQPAITLPYGFSVAHYGFYLARIMGASPIVFTGLDLAYTGDRDHAADCSDVWHMDKSRNDFPLVPDVYGNMVKTDYVFLYMISLFEKEIAQTKAPCIDATEGGVYIDGTQVMTFKDTIRLFGLTQKPDFHDIFHHLWVKNRSDNTNDIIEGLKWLTHESEAVNRICEKALTLIVPLVEQVEKNIDGQPNFQPKIDRINRLADEMAEHEPFKEIVKDRLAKVLVDQFHSQFQLERAKDEKEKLLIGIRQSHLFFQEMDRASHSIHKIVKPLLKTVKARKETIQP